MMTELKSFTGGTVPLSPLSLNSSSLLVDVGLKTVNLGLHRADSLQDLLLRLGGGKKELNNNLTNVWPGVSGNRRRRYLDGDAKVVSVFNFWNEVLDPAGDLRRQTLKVYFSETVGSGENRLVVDLRR